MGKLSKAKKLTNVEKYSIEGMLSNNMEPEAIAQALGRAERLVLAYVELLNKKDTNLRKKTRGGSSGVSIMTEAASQSIDSSRSNKTTTGKNPSIHTIHE